MWTVHEKFLIHTGLLPEAAVEGIDYAYMPMDDVPFLIFRHDAATVDALRSRGMVVPSVEEGFGYRGVFAPMQHQRETVKFFTDNKRCYCANGLGTGKTLAALWAAECLKDTGDVRRVLIVAPNTILEKVWGLEFFRTAPHRTYWIARGDRRKKKAIAADPAIDYIVVNPESLFIIEEEVIAGAFDLIIVDEATKFKTYNTRQTKSLLHMAAGRRLILMSGTPTPQSPLDAYSQIRLLRDGKYKPMYWFRDQTMVQVNQFKWVPKHDAAATVARELTPSIRFHRDECLDLPELQVVDIEVQASAEQDKAVKELQEEAFSVIKGQPITAVNAGVVFSKVLQVMAGGVYHADPENPREKTVAEVDASGVLDTIEGICSEADTPVLIFTSFRSSVAIISKHLEDNGYSVGQITGDTKPSERAEIFNKVQSGELNAMVAVASTVAHGLTLTASNTIIWAVPTLVQETYEQANARIYRKGQTRKCVVYRLVVNKLAKELYKRLDDKTSLQDTLLKLLEDFT